MRPILFASGLPSAVRATEFLPTDRGETTSMSQPAAAPPAISNRHPRGFWFFFWGELAERCSYYGMNAILLLYMTDTLKFAKPDASFFLNLFIAGCYFAPLLGGFIADRFLGKYWTIVLFSVPYVIGNALMVVPSVYTLAGALVILALGSGVIKPNISTLMGMTYDQQRPGQDLLRSQAFTWFYWAINIGSLISMTGMPLLRDQVGPNLAFLLPTILMATALLIFALGKRYYAVETLTHPEKTPEERAAQWKAVGRLLGIFVLITVFWAIFKQYASTWVEFTRDRVDTRLAFDILGWKFDRTFAPDQFQFLNALFVLTLLPLSTVVFAWLQRRGTSMRPTDKMQLGFAFTFIVPVLFVLADQTAGAGKANLIWIVGIFFCITVAEVLISPVGLELAFIAAPKSIKSFITACFLLTVGIASLINAVVTPWYTRTDSSGERLIAPTTYFTAHAVVVAVAFVAFFFIARPFNRALAGKQQTEAH